MKPIEVLSDHLLELPIVQLPYYHLLHYNLGTRRFHDTRARNNGSTPNVSINTSVSSDRTHMLDHLSARVRRLSMPKVMHGLAGPRVSFAGVLFHLHISRQILFIHLEFPVKQLHPKGILEMMFPIPARQRLFLVTRRRPLIAVSRFNTRPASTLSNPVSKTNESRFNTKRVLYAAGGGSLAILGLMWTGRSRCDSPNDPRDRKALSTVPLTKLLSGWV